MADFFLSYSRKDQAWVRELASKLADLDREALVDVEGILPSEEWRERLEQMIRESDDFVFILSDASVTSHECGRELEIARRLGKRMLPLNHKLTSDDIVPELLRERQRIEAPPQKDIGLVAEELSEAHDTDIERVRLHTRLLLRAAEWKANVRGSLLSGDALVEAERFVGTVDADPPATDLQREFVVASRKAVTRRRQITGFVAVAVLIVLGIVGWFAREQQLASRCNGLLGAAQASITRDPAVARTHALDAAEPCAGDRRAALDQIVARLLLSPRPVQRVGPVAGSSVLLSTDGSLLAVGPKRTGEIGGSTAGLQVWRLEDGALVATLEDFSAPPAKLHATEKSLIVVDTVGQLGIWDRDEGQVIGNLELGPDTRKAMLGDRMVDVAPADRGNGMVVRVWDDGGGPHVFELGSGASGEVVLDPWLEFRAEVVGDKVRIAPSHAAPSDLQGTTKGGLVVMLSVAVSPDGALVAGANENAVDVWHRDGTHAAILQDSDEPMQTWTLGFDPESRWLITTQGRARYASVWGAKGLRKATGLDVSQPFLRLHGDVRLWDAQFGSDPATVVTLRGDGHAVVWGTGLPVAQFDVLSLSRMAPQTSGSGWQLSRSDGPWVLQSIFDPDERIELSETMVISDPSGRFELRGSEDGGTATLSLVQDDSTIELRRMSENLRFVDLLGISTTGRHYAVGSIRESDRRFVVHRCDVCGMDAEAALQALLTEENLVGD